MNLGDMMDGPVNDEFRAERKLRDLYRRALADDIKAREADGRPVALMQRIELGSLTAQVREMDGKIARCRDLALEVQ